MSDFSSGARFLVAFIDQSITEWIGLEHGTEEGGECRDRVFPLASALLTANGTWLSRTKKADVVEYPQIFGHVGLLVNGPSGNAGLPFA